MVKRFAYVLIPLALLAALLFYGMSRNPDRRDNVRSALSNKPVPAFDLATFNAYQQEYGPSLGIGESFKGPLVINFWASWCPPCRDEAPVLERLWQDYQDDLLILGINTQDPQAGNAEAFLDEFKLSFPNVRDEKSRVSIDYGVLGLPETFFIRKDGTLSFRHAGPLTKDIFEREVAKILQ
ncbi:MAG: TlpA disulfide reductase family protein [Deinococcales bacterium]